MEDKEKKPGSAEQPKKSSVNWYGVILIVILVVVVGFPFWLALTPAGPGTGSAAYFKSVAAFQKKFAPVMAFPTYYPEAFDWRGHENEWFEYENKNGKVSFTTSAYDVKSTRTRLYANAGYNGRGVLYQSRKDLNIYHGAYIGVSLAYPENGVPDAWLFYVGMSTEINPKNPPATTGEELRIDGKEVYFDFYRQHFEDSQRDPFVLLNYTFLYDDRNYTFDFGIRIEPTLSQEKQDELLAEMKQHCLEEAVKMYDSLEYLKNAK